MRLNAAIDYVTIFLLMIFIVSALPCTISGVRFSQMSKILGRTEAAEGYVLSKYSDYRSFDLEYTWNDTLYVWAWSYRIDPNHLMENYCQLKWGKYEPTFSISYHPNMTRQYSYVGSFKLSSLEKTGDYELHIFLRSKPKPPPASYNPEASIHVSDVTPPPATYTLVVTSTPIAEILFTLDDQQYTTRWSGSLTDVIHTIRMPSSVIVGSGLLLLAAVMFYVGLMGLLTLLGVTAYILMRRRRRHIREEIKETEYRITLEEARLEAMLQELYNLLGKGVLSMERYEAIRREIEDELTKIRGLKS